MHFYLHICMHTMMCVPDALRGQKTMSEPPEKEL